MRLDKFLANMGKGSRKDIRIFVKAGIVTIDGKPAKSFDQQIDPEKNIVKFQGELVQYKPFVYLMMNKPAGVYLRQRILTGKEQPWIWLEKNIQCMT